MFFRAMYAICLFVLLCKDINGEVAKNLSQLPLDLKAMVVEVF